MTKRFPRSEPDIATLSVPVIAGLTNAAEDFPSSQGLDRRQSAEARRDRAGD